VDLKADLKRLGLEHLFGRPWPEIEKGLLDFIRRTETPLQKAPPAPAPQK
jgi:hypothetical protein